MKGSTNYSRKICAVFWEYEKCSNLINFKTTQAPVIIEKEIYEKKTILNYSLNSNYKYYVSKWWIVDLYASRTFFRIYWKNIWDIEIYVKDNTWRHIYTYIIRILPKPQPITYDLELPVWWATNIYLPQSINNYNRTIENPQNSVSLYWNRRNSDILQVNANRMWKSTIYLKEKNGWIKYIINVEVKVDEQYFALNETDCIDTWYNDNYNFRSEDNSISSIEWVRKRIHDSDKAKTFVWLCWKRVWTTKINISKYWAIRKIWHITVNPRPEPKVLKCSVEVWQDCSFYLKSSSYYYTNDWKLEISWSRNRIRTKALQTWNSKVYVKSYDWEYITHILEIEGKPKPPKIYTCETPIWRYCESHKQEVYDGYSFTTTTPNIISVEKERIWSTNWRTNYENFKIIWNTQWETEVYIYHHWDLISIVKTKVIPAVKEIKLKDNSIKLKQWESFTTEVLEWWWDYKTWEYNKELIYFDVDMDWEIQIKAKNEWKTWARVEDKWNQVEDIKVIIKDTNLVLWWVDEKWKITLNLKVWEEYLQPIYESNWSVSISKEIDWSSNILVRNKFSSNPVNYYETNYLEIIAKKSWRSVIWLRDSEWNPGRIVVNVSGKNEEEEEKEDSDNNENNNWNDDIDNLINELNINFIQYILDLILNSLNTNSTENSTKISNTWLSDSTKNKIDSKFNKLTGKEKFKWLDTERKIKLFRKLKSNYQSSLSNLDSKSYSDNKKEILIEIYNYLISRCELYIEKYEADLELKITELEYTSYIDDWYLGWLYFKTQWKILEIWVDYEYLWGNVSWTQKNKNK